MNIIFSYTPPYIKEPQWFKWYSTDTFDTSTGRDYSTRASSMLDLIPEPKCFSYEFLRKFGDMEDMMKNKKLKENE